MTRETKVGLVVATSFLSLVGVVVAARMSTPEPGAKKLLADARSEKKAKSREASASSDPEKKQTKEGKGVVPAGHDEPGNKPAETTAPPPFGPLPGAEPVLPPKNVDPKPSGAPPTTEDPFLKTIKEKMELAQGPPPPVRNDPPSAPPSLPTDPPKTGPTAVPPPNVPVKPETTTPPTKPEGPGLAKPEPIVPTPDPAANATKPLLTPGPTAGNNGPNNGPPLAPEGKPLVSTGTPNPIPEPKPPSPAPSPSPAPLGAPPPVSSPPISVALAAGQTNNNTLPQVRQYDINAYSIKPDDRSFGDISQKLYSSDKYARALVLFNRDHPQATEGIRQEPPQVRPGTPVFYPPKEILESKYASAITAASAGPTNSSPISVGTPTPLTAVTPGNPNSVASPPPGTNVWSEPGGGKNYRVGNNPEPILDIARAVLGDTNRWGEIYRLNPTINPSYPIPAGTVLKLP